METKMRGHRYKKILICRSILVPCHQHKVHSTSSRNVQGNFGSLSKSQIAETGALEYATVIITELTIWDTRVDKLGTLTKVIGDCRCPYR